MRRKRRSKKVSMELSMGEPLTIIINNKIIKTRKFHLPIFIQGNPRMLNSPLIL